MIPSDIIHACQKDGITIQLDENGNLRCGGGRSALRKWEPKLKEHKPALIRLLSGQDDNSRAAEPVPGNKSGLTDGAPKRAVRHLPDHETPSAGNPAEPERPPAKSVAFHLNNWSTFDWSEVPLIAGTYGLDEQALKDYLWACRQVDLPPYYPIMRGLVKKRSCADSEQ